jgi:uncharacterized protein YyaL (SSP411 family)
LLAEPRYLQAAERVLRGAWHDLNQHSVQHATLLQALDEYLQPPAVIVQRGAAAELGRWQRQLQRLYAPRQLGIAVPAHVTALPPALADKPAPDDGVRAWVCRGNSCTGPFTSLAAVAAL